MKKKKKNEGCKQVYYFTKHTATDKKRDRLCNQIIRLKKGLSEQDQLVQDVYNYYNYFTSTSQLQRTCAYSTIIMI